ncbi:hypothetical protein V8G54_007800 [Vigna mungo]|uniref:Uncharacterized protein n=1 Tax=Vigna mungo TaxID=3915 RepID=A0AAQ3S8M0_VIGMU
MELVKVFYTNLKVNGNGHISSKVKSTNIITKPTYWIIICNLSYEGQKLSFQIISEDLLNDECEPLNSLVKPHLDGWMVRNVGSLNINDRLLHYVFVHILSP